MQAELPGVQAELPGVPPLAGPEGRGRLPAAAARRVGEGEVVEVFEGVEVSWAGSAGSPADAVPGSVMAGAPSVAMRLPRQS